MGSSIDTLQEVLASFPVKVTLRNPVAHTANMGC